MLLDKSSNEIGKRFLKVIHFQQPRYLNRSQKPFFLDYSIQLCHLIFESCYIRDSFCSSCDFTHEIIEILKVFAEMLCYLGLRMYLLMFRIQANVNLAKIKFNIMPLSIYTTIISPKLLRKRNLSHCCLI